MDPKQNTNQPQVPNVPAASNAAPAAPPVVPAQSIPVASPTVPSIPDVKGKSRRWLFIAFLPVFVVVSGSMLYYVFFISGAKQPKQPEAQQVQTQIQPTATPVQQTEEEQLDEVSIASPEADLSDLEKDLDSL